MNNIRLYMHVATVTLMNLIHAQTCIAKKGGAHAPPGYGPALVGYGAWDGSLHRLYKN